MISLFLPKASLLKDLYPQINQPNKKQKSIWKWIYDLHSARYIRQLRLTSFESVDVEAGNFNRIAVLVGENASWAGNCKYGPTSVYKMFTTPSKLSWNISFRPHKMAQ